MRHVAMILFLIAAPFAFGCENPVDAIDEGTDCRNVCDRYQTCYDETYDTASCRNRCNTLVDADGGRRSAADDCDACMDDMSCSTAVFTCAVACQGILP